MHFLSDKQFSIFPPAPSPTEAGAEMLKPIVTHNISSNPPSEIHESDTLEWLSSWIPTAPSLSNIQSGIPLPGFPSLSTGVSELIG